MSKITKKTTVLILGENKITHQIILNDDDSVSLLLFQHDNAIISRKDYNERVEVLPVVEFKILPNQKRHRLIEWLTTATVNLDALSEAKEGIEKAKSLFDEATITTNKGAVL